jgi:hypothetical protein
MSSAAFAIAPSGAVTTRSRAVVPAETTAAGVAAGRPCSINRSARRSNPARPMKATSVPGTRASAAASSRSTSCAANAVTADERPRCVTGMPAEAGTDASDDTPGMISNGTPAPASASASSPPRPKRKGSPPLSRTTSWWSPSATSRSFTSSCSRWSRSMRSASAGASSTSSAATRRSYTSTSHARTRWSPFTVMRPGSPGPAPTRATVIRGPSPRRRGRNRAAPRTSRTSA